MAAGRNYGERRTAETLVDGAVLLGDLTQQAGQILLQDSGIQIALASDPTDGVALKSTGLQVIVNGGTIADLLSGAARAVRGLRVAEELSIEPESVQTGSSYTQVATDGVLVFNSAPSTLTMIDAARDGQCLIVVNKSSSNALTLDDAGTTLTDVRESPVSAVTTLNTLASTLLYWVSEDSSWYRLF